MKRAVLAAAALAGLSLAACTGGGAGGGTDGDSESAAPSRTTAEVVASWLEPQSCPTGIAAASGLDIADSPEDGLIAAPSPTLLLCFFGNDITGGTGNSLESPAAFVIAGTGATAEGMVSSKDQAAAGDGTVTDLPEFGTNAYRFTQGDDETSVCAVMATEGEGESAAAFSVTVAGPADFDTDDLCDAALGIARMR